MPRTTALADVHVDLRLDAIPENDVLDLCRQLRKRMIPFFESQEGQANYRDWKARRLQADQKGETTE